MRIVEPGGLKIAPGKPPVYALGARRRALKGAPLKLHQRLAVGSKYRMRNGEIHFFFHRSKWK